MTLAKYFLPVILSTFLLFLFLNGCGKRPDLIPLVEHNLPIFQDSGDRESLINATKAQIEYLEKLNPNSTIVLAGDTYANIWLLHSAKHFLTLLQQYKSSEELAEIVADEFQIYQAGGRLSKSAKEMLITGYYEPLLEGRLQKTPPFIYPLYSLPENLVNIDNKGLTNIFRQKENGKLTPYWTRAEIEQENHLKGLELIYLKDPVDAFSLHVQGSGKILLKDGKVRSIRYAGSNGRPYSSIGKLFVDEGIMELEEVTMPKIRQYLTNNPDELERILYHNKKFIFFSWAPTNKPPHGSSGVSLTPKRSIAIDPTTLPAGAIGYIMTREPIFDSEGKLTAWKPFNHFVLPQDSGSAIKGAGRADIFWGHSSTAKAKAGVMKEVGALFFLVKKGYQEKHN